MRRATRCEMLGLFARACAACPPGGARGGEEGNCQLGVGCWVGSSQYCVALRCMFAAIWTSHDIAVQGGNTGGTAQHGPVRARLSGSSVVVVVAVPESPNGLSIARAPRHRMSLLTRGFLGLIWLLKSRYMLYVVLYVVYSSRARFGCRWLLRRRLDCQAPSDRRKARFRALVVRCVEKEDDLLPVPPARSCAQEIVFLRAGE